MMSPLIMFCYGLLSVAAIRFALHGVNGEVAAAVGPRQLAVPVGSVLASTVALFGFLYYSFKEAAPGADIPGPYRAVPLLAAIIVATAATGGLVLRRSRHDSWQAMGAVF